MALIDYIDPVNRRIHLSIDTMNTAWHPVDLYREVRALRASNESLRPFDNFMRGAGNIDKGGGKATERYFTLLLGTRIVPYNASHVIDITGTLITDDGFEGAFCFDKSTLTIGVSVDIQYAPKQVEVVNLNFDDLVFASFLGGVWYNVDSPYGDVGSANFPNGNRERPVNSIPLATQIAIDRGFDTINVLGALTLGAGDDVAGFTLQGSNPTKCYIAIEDAAVTHGCEIKLATVTGILDGGTVLRECLILGMTYINGFVDECVLEETTIVLGGAASALFMRCVGRRGVLTIDMGGSGQALNISDHHGRLKIINKTGTDDCTIHMSAGQVDIDATVINGPVYLDGIGRLHHKQSGSEIITNDMISGTDVANIQKLIELQRPYNSSTGKIIYWSPYDGSDLSDGSHYSRPVKTFAQAQVLADDYGHDMIIGLANDPTGITYADEVCVMTKNYLSLRSTGTGFIIKPTTVEGIPLTISAKGNSVSNLQLQTAATFMWDALLIQGAAEFVTENVWISNCSGSGIHLVDAGYGKILSGYLQSLGNHGIEIGNGVSHVWIGVEGIHGAANDGIHIEGNSGFGGTSEIKLIKDIDIHWSGGYGLNIVSGGSMTRMSKDMFFMNNSLGDVNDPLGKIAVEGNFATAERLVDIVGSVASSGLATKGDVYGAKFM